MLDRAFISVLSLTPKSTLSRLLGELTRAQGSPLLHQLALRAFVRAYGVDLSEAELPLSEYATFAEFFTRRLRPGVRPVAGGEQIVVSPVDGRVAAFGVAEAGTLLQAKGCGYPLSSLLNDPIDGRQFAGGAYLTLYLAPNDYHRIHAPLGGEIEGYSYIPGRLFPVNAAAVRWVPQLFCTNERLVSYLKTAAGRVAVVKVGALNVGRIRAAYDDIVTNARRGAARRRYEKPVPVKKGEELGVFELGSTVILLFEPGKVTLEGSLREGEKVRMGQPIARVA